MRPPTGMILKEIVGINPFHRNTYRLDNRRTCFLSELMTIHNTPSPHRCSLRSSLSINCTDVIEDHLQDIWTNEPAAWLIAINKIIASATSFQSRIFFFIFPIFTLCQSVFNKESAAERCFPWGFAIFANILKGHPTPALQENELIYSSRSNCTYVIRKACRRSSTRYLIQWTNNIIYNDQQDIHFSCSFQSRTFFSRSFHDPPFSSCARVFSIKNLVLKDVFLEVLQYLQTSGTNASQILLWVRCVTILSGLWFSAKHF